MAFILTKPVKSLANQVVSLHNGNVTQTFNTTLTAILFNTIVRIDAGYYTYNSGLLTISLPGSYLISFDVSYRGTTNNITTCQTAIYKNGILIPGTTAYSNHSSASHGQQTTTSQLNVICNAGDVISVRGIRVSGNGSLVTQPNGCRLNIRKIR